MDQEFDFSPDMSQLTDMDSRWFANFSAEQRRLREADKKKTNAVPTIIAILLVMFGGAVLWGGAEATTVIFGLFIPMAIIGYILNLVTKLGRVSDTTKDLQLSLAHLLTTPQEVKQFDAEMSAEPLDIVQGTESIKICFTEHYIYTDERYMGFRTIAVARYTDLRSSRNTNGKSWTKTNPYNRHYYVDLLDEEEKRALTLSLEDDQMADLEACLLKHCLQIQLQHREE